MVRQPEFRPGLDSRGPVVKPLVGRDRGPEVLDGEIELSACHRGHPEHAVRRAGTHDGERSHKGELGVRLQRLVGGVGHQRHEGEEQGKECVSHAANVERRFRPSLRKA